MITSAARLPSGFALRSGRSDSNGNVGFLGLALTAIVTVGYQMVVFLITVLLRFDKLTDFASSTNFVILAILTLYFKGACHFRQAAWVWTVSLPDTIVNASSRVRMTKMEGMLVGQSYEMLLWWGIFVASTPVLSGAEWLVISGPIFLSWLLLFVSGIPLLEKSADKLFSGTEECRLYKKTTRCVLLCTRLHLVQRLEQVCRAALLEQPSGRVAKIELGLGIFQEK